MPIFLSSRDTQIREKMDNPDCDIDLLKNTYRQFSTINKLLGGWRGIYRRFIKPMGRSSDRPISILDIGCGGGDIVKYLSELSGHDNLDVTFTGIDPDHRAIEFARNTCSQKNIQFRQISSSQLVEQGESYDIVISNHLLHHLQHEQLLNLCRDAEQLCQKLVLFNDIERSDLGYAAFRTISPMLFRNSFISEDGITSIKRSFTKDELRNAVPDQWLVQRKFPFRLLATFRPEG